MLKKILWALLIVVTLIVVYFLVWPVPIDPVAWEAPSNPGYTGPFAILGCRFRKIESEGKGKTGV